ncbi:tRNA dihydrouridine(20/20a) synthase DusA [Thiomicrospira sp. ALE5]|uniref:tRNA dihydrouridine(20/20a) synthase DusA n=1 Tax=Thiomicrospira sp. ALE5 TaxID=748650 RepID=UPI0008E7C59E|nr:tRNA dihydrouridine(20/20a) synthase DusA [Thiomicrospira sp. ALE5]SFR49963.1 tRNA-U16,U17-dihydrouridine synthase [Thiomicrospira sp. ALE5]
MDSSSLYLNSASGFSVAPMLDWTDRHCRYFHRLMTQQAWLYSEMVTTGAMIYGNNLPRFIGRDPADSPVVLQLGGSKPDELAQCARLGEDWGYNEINLNVGCPSDRVQNNLIGACLMAHPQLVAEGVAAMKAAVAIPVTVKCRIGIDEQEDYQTLADFIAGLVQAGVDGVVIHARKAWLQGLSPKENRDVPPLNYAWVHQIKADFADLAISINGGLKTLVDAKQHLSTYDDLPAVDGVMMGRAIYENPYLLAEVDGLFYADPIPAISRAAVLEAIYPYIEAHLQAGGRLSHITRHMMGLFHGCPGGRLWRRALSEQACLPDAGIEVLQNAHQRVLIETQRMAEQEARRAVS